VEEHPTEEVLDRQGPPASHGVYIQLDIIEGCGRSFWAIHSMPYVTSPGPSGMMQVINSIKVQRGDQPDAFKPMPTIGKGVEEIRVSDSTGAYRVIYVARRAEAVYVLHAFQKKTQTTSKNDIQIAKERFRQLSGGRI
jgi:phage-related protein